jgi:predicted RNase H-like HicB family nuclease
MQYQIKLKKSEEGYAVWCPSLPGCASQGETREEAIANIQDAIQSYLEVLNELKIMVGLRPKVEKEKFNGF